MAALSDYLESGISRYLFAGQSFPVPANISIALTTDVPQDNQNGSSIPEVPQTVEVSGETLNTGYARINYSTPASDGNTKWNFVEGGSGITRNASQIVFNTALQDWGLVSGIAILDSSVHGSGNLLLHAELEKPREVCVGDSIKFDTNTLEIFLK